jgi:hypothetical protein
MHLPIIRAVSDRSFTDAEIDAAIEALSDPERFREAEAQVTRLAPQLQNILNQALHDGGWFDQQRNQALSETLAGDDPAERERQVATLLADETRIGMLVGVAIGWALAEELEGKRDA